uniref:CUB domain-containing protein n=1 Tax=Panagrolaimus sp. JU765 TaxID=591449 RepID=A0AC34RGZ2_9BILA
MADTIETSYEDSVDKENLPNLLSASQSTNCPNDYLEVRDGRYSFSPLIGQFCGMKSPNSEVRARSGYMWLHFHSDNLLEYRGFMAEYEFVRGPIFGHDLLRPLDCYFSFAMSLDGIIDMSEMHQFYIENRNSTGSLDCVWQIQVPNWLSIAIFAEDFSLSLPNQCHKNFLEIYAGSTANSPLKRYCGINANHVYSNQPTIFVRVFGTDSKSILETKLRLLFSTYVALKNCSLHNLFSCGDDICIPQELVCSGKSNCLYGRDENHCVTNENVKSVVFSGYGTMIVIVLFVIGTVVGLIFWYQPFKKNEVKVDAYLKELCNQPPPGLTQTNRQRAASKRINSLLADFTTLTPDSSPSMSGSITMTDLAHHSHCSTLKPLPVLNGGCSPIRTVDRRFTDSNLTGIPTTGSGVSRIIANRRLHSLSTSLMDVQRRQSTETVVEVAEVEDDQPVDENGNAETSFYGEISQTVFL